jgi:hypothetical protein
MIVEATIQVSSRSAPFKVLGRRELNLPRIESEQDTVSHQIELEKHG